MIEQQIREAIEQNLPSTVGDVLKTRLETAERDAKDVIALREQVDRLLTQTGDMSTRLLDIGMREHVVADRELKVAAREAKANLDELKVQLYKERLDDFRGILNAVFANSRFKYSESGMVPIANVPGGYGYTSVPTSKVIDSLVEPDR